jgi:uncharacterized DUF497 family protein
MPLSFEWDQKARSNATKHGVRFDEASTVFGDALSLTISDPAHSQTEDRFVTLGRSHRGKLLVIRSHGQRRQYPDHQRSPGEQARTTHV